MPRTWREDFLIHLMNESSKTRCSCKVCWKLREKKVDLLEDTVKQKNLKIGSLERLGKIAKDTKGGLTDCAKQHKNDHLEKTV